MKSLTTKRINPYLSILQYLMNCFFVHSKDPKHLDTATTQLCELFSADTEQTFGCIYLQGMLQEIGMSWWANLKEGRDVGNTTSNLFCVSNVVVFE